VGVKLAPVVLSFALATNAGCGGRQLTNRQVAIGIGAAVAVVVLIYLLSTECDNDNGNDCTFQKPTR
jgi:hypothetical protein